MPYYLSVALQNRAPNFPLLSTHYELGALPAHSTGQETGSVGRATGRLLVLTLAEARGWRCRDGGIDLLGGAEQEPDSTAWTQPGSCTAHVLRLSIPTPCAPRPRLCLLLPNLFTWPFCHLGTLVYFVGKKNPCCFKVLFFKRHPPPAPSPPCLLLGQKKQFWSPLELLLLNLGNLPVR